MLRVLEKAEESTGSTDDESSVRHSFSVSEMHSKTTPRYWTESPDLRVRYVRSAI
jgi:hypothetical protein